MQERVSCVQGHAAARPLLEALTGMAPRQLGVHHVHVFDGARCFALRARSA